MVKIHVVIRRINPVLKIDLAQVGYLEDNQFVSLPMSAIAGCPILQYLHCSDVSDSLYIYHSSLADVVTTGANLPGFCVEFYDNMFVLMFDFNLDRDESAKEEEGKGN